LKEEFPDDYNFLARLQNMRGDAPAPLHCNSGNSPPYSNRKNLKYLPSAAGDLGAFDSYLQLGDKKYVVSSKIADFEAIRRNLTWNISLTRR
jgi:hypothetical protein